MQKSGDLHMPKTPNLVYLIYGWMFQNVLKKFWKFSFFGAKRGREVEKMEENVQNVQN